MVGKMCSKFGRPLCVLDGMVYSCFPEVSRLAEEGSETELRKLGFGYRAAYVQKSAQFIMQYVLDFVSDQSLFLRSVIDELNLDVSFVDEASLSPVT